MDNKLKAITNNVRSSGSAVDLIERKNDKHDVKEAACDYRCHRKVPVLFSTIRGVHLRKLNKSSVDGNYSITFCDLERWVRREWKTDRELVKI